MEEKLRGARMCTPFISNATTIIPSFVGNIRRMSLRMEGDF